MNTPAKRGFRSPTEFIEAANSPAPLMHVDPVEGVTLVKPADTPEPAPAPAVGEGAPAAQAAPQATNEAAQAPAAAKAPARPPRPAKSAADKTAVHTHKRATDDPPKPPPAPWEGFAEDAMAPPFNVRMTKELHAKLAWIADNVPKHKSMHVVCINAITAYADDLIAKHYQPEQE